IFTWKLKLSMVDVIAERIYREVQEILRELTQLRAEDYDVALLQAQLILPIARYLCQDNAVHWVKPIFVSGEPGIGKTTLMMILDEALWRLGFGSCRALVAAGEIRGYFADKTPLPVTPLHLFGMQTAVLSTRDWTNMLRYWTYDESEARNSVPARSDFLDHLRGKVVMVDEAELEGYV